MKNVNVIGEIQNKDSLENGIKHSDIKTFTEKYSLGLSLKYIHESHSEDINKLMFFVNRANDRCNKKQYKISIDHYHQALKCCSQMLDSINQSFYKLETIQLYKQLKFIECSIYIELHEIHCSFGKKSQLPKQNREQIKSKISKYENKYQETLLEIQKLNILKSMLHMNFYKNEEVKKAQTSEYDFPENKKTEGEVNKYKYSLTETPTLSLYGSSRKISTFVCNTDKELNEIPQKLQKKESFKEIQNFTQNNNKIGEETTHPYDKNFYKQLFALKNSPDEIKNVTDVHLRSFRSSEEDPDSLLDLSITQVNNLYGSNDLAGEITLHDTNI